MNYKQIGFLGSAFLGYKNVINDLRGRKRGERSTLAATENGKVEAAERLRPEQKSDALLRDVVSPFRQPGIMVVDRSAETFSTAIVCLTVPLHRVFAGCKADLEYFRVAKEAEERRFWKCALDAETGVKLSREAAEAAVSVASFVPEATTADQPRSPPDVLPLCQCIA